MNNTTLDLINTGEIGRYDRAIDTEDLYNFDAAAYRDELREIEESENGAIDDLKREW